MCCNTGSHHGSERWGQPGVCFCGCDDVMNFRPRFMTKEQRINRLKRYQEDLRNEAKAVEEHIAHIKKRKVDWLLRNGKARKRFFPYPI